MSSLLNALNQEKQRYYNLRGTLSQTADYLLKCYNALEKPTTIEHCYKIDENSFDNNNIKNCREIILSKYQFLTGGAILEIDNEIKRLNIEISKEEERIRIAWELYLAEQRAKAEAAKASSSK